MILYIVLMIDDDPDSIERVERYLQPEMYRLYHALDPFEGIDLAKELIPDVIILDIRMPGLDGYEVCRRLRNQEASQQIPIIIYSVVGDEDEAYILGLNLGAHAVVPKGKLSRLKAALERFVSDEGTQGLQARNDTLPQVREFRRQGYVLKIQGEAERVWLDSEEKVLRPLVRKLLAALASRPGVPVQSEELVQELYDGEEKYNRGPKDVHRLMHDLRTELEPAPHEPIFVVNVPRRGYRLLGSDETTC